MSERVVGSLSYLTSGIVGLIWLIIGVVTKKNMKQFLQYHIFQSIFLMLTFYIIANLLALVMNILSYIPFLNKIVSGINFVFNVPFISFAFIHLSIINIFILLFLVYLVIGTMLGKYVKVPWVSDIIRANLY